VAVRGTGAGDALPASSGPWSDVMSSMSSAPPGTGKDDPETARSSPERDGGFYQPALFREGRRGASPSAGGPFA
jgi:hypothetical protein